MKNLTLESSIWIDSKHRPLLGKGRIELLKLIDKTGSLSKAAKEMGMSYKAAWDAIVSINKASDTPLLQSNTGGKNGGGSSLTEAGRLYIKLYEKIYKEQKKFFSSLEEHIDNFDDFTKRNSLRTSARNQLYGQIINIEKNDLSAEVSVNIGCEICLKSIVSTKSISELGLKKNSPVWLIIKITWVELLQENDKKTDNVFKAYVKNIKKQSENSEIELELSNSVLLVASFLNKANTLKKGDIVDIFIDKTNIILGI